MEDEAYSGTSGTPDASAPEPISTVPPPPPPPEPIVPAVPNPPLADAGPLSSALTDALAGCIEPPDDLLGPDALQGGGTVIVPPPAVPNPAVEDEPPVLASRPANVERLAGADPVSVEQEHEVTMLGLAELRLDIKRRLAERQFYPEVTAEGVPSNKASYMVQVNVYESFVRYYPHTATIKHNELLTPDASVERFVEYVIGVRDRS